MTTAQIKELRLKGFRNFKNETGEWKNLFRGRGYPSSPNKWASSKQRNKIYFELEERGIDVYTTIFKIGGKEKKLFELSCGDAWNILQALRKNKIKELIK